MCEGFQVPFEFIQGISVLERPNEIYFLDI